MIRPIVTGAALATAFLGLFTGSAYAQRFSTTFSGFNEIGGLGAGETGAVRSLGTGTLDLNLDQEGGTLDFTLTYSGLTSPVTQSHIHFGKTRVAGGVMVFFCGPPSSPAHQTCPPEGTVTGTIIAADVQPLPGQNVPGGDFGAVVDALLSNTAYGNIHTMNFPAGEIRGQIRRASDDDHGEGNHRHHD